MTRLGLRMKHPSRIELPILLSTRRESMAGLAVEIGTPLPALYVTSLTSPQITQIDADDHFLWGAFIFATLDKNSSMSIRRFFYLRQSA